MNEPLRSIILSGCTVLDEGIPFDRVIYTLLFLYGILDD